MTDEQYLCQAIEISHNSPEPVGCGVLIVQNSAILAKTYNSQRADNIAVNHAEIKAIIEANKKLDSRKLADAVADCKNFVPGLEKLDI